MVDGMRWSCLLKPVGLTVVLLLVGVTVGCATRADPRNGAAGASTNTVQSTIAPTTTASGNGVPSRTVPAVGGLPAGIEPYDAHGGLIWVRPSLPSREVHEEWVANVLDPDLLDARHPGESLPLLLVSPLPRFPEDEETWTAGEPKRVNVRVLRLLWNRDDLDRYIRLQSEILTAIGRERPSALIGVTVTFEPGPAPFELRAFMQRHQELRLTYVEYDHGDGHGAFGVDPPQGGAPDPYAMGDWYQYVTCAVYGPAAACVGLLGEAGVAAVDGGAVEEWLRLQDLGYVPQGGSTEHGLGGEFKTLTSGGSQTSLRTSTTPTAP